MIARVLERFPAKWKRFAVRKRDHAKKTRAYSDSNEAGYALSIGLICVASAVLLGDAQAIVAIPPLVGTAIDPGAGAPDIAPRTAPRPAPPVESAPTGNPLWAIPLNKLTNTRERPIFSPSRRPPPRVVADAPRAARPPRTPPKPAEPEKPPLLLVGTVIGERGGIGVFVDDSTKEPVRLKTGEAHKGWVLRVVDRREVTLQKNQETATLALPQPGIEKPEAAAQTDTRTRNRRR